MEKAYKLTHTMMIGDSLNTFCCILLFPSWMIITNLYLVFTVHGHFTKRFKNKRLGPFGHDHNLMRKGTLLLSLCKCRHSDLETQIDLPKVIKLCSRQSPEPRLLEILILASLFPRLKISMTVLINTPKVKERKKRKEKKGWKKELWNPISQYFIRVQLQFYFIKL